MPCKGAGKGSRIVSLGTSSPSHRSLKISLLIVAAAAMTMLLSQCRMVSDSVVGPGASVAAQKPSKDCFRDCQDAFKAAQDVEQALHKTNVKACNTNPVCLANEEARHAARMDQIAVERQACIDGCHHQGGGSGGR
jgi:hypothetical protein